MPDTVATPPPVPHTAVAPTPSKEYKLSEHPAAPSAPRNPDLTAALSRRAGVAPGKEPPKPVSEPKVVPAQPPRPTESPTPPPAADDDKPAPHVKFIAADDREPEGAKAPVTTAPSPSEPTEDALRQAPVKLREAYERLKSDFAERAREGEVTRKQLTEFQAKAKGYEDRIKALESVEGRAKELEKQALALDEQLRIANYTQHPEFHEKYVKPVAEAMQSAIATVKDLLVTEADGNVRAGTDSDFHEVLGQPNTTLAVRKAKELFGDEFATLVVEERKRVRAAQETQARAVKDAGLRSAEWLKNRQDAEAANRSRTREALEAQIKAQADRYPSLYTPPEGDKDAAAARKSGEELAAMVVYGVGDQPVSQEKWLETVAKVYHRASAFPMRELALQRASEEIESLKSRLAKYEASTPDTSSRQTPGGSVGQRDSGGVVVAPGFMGDALKQQMRESLERRSRGGR